MPFEGATVLALKASLCELVKVCLPVEVAAPRSTPPSGTKQTALDPTP